MCEILELTRVFRDLSSGIEHFPVLSHDFTDYTKQDSVVYGHYQVKRHGDIKIMKSLHVFIILAGTRMPMHGVNVSGVHDNLK